ncbi:thrombospondin type 3 repeat-containing protein [Myxococcota bacterium]|nr:thrombospondin type 3 repeat-containing protein [Myxococcota bacterium]
MSTLRGRRRALHTVLHLAGLTGAVSGCSLDFDKFKEASLEPDVRLIDVGGPTGGGMTEDVPIFADAATDAGLGDMGATTDTDGDGVPDGADNCPMAPNPGQEDGDADGEGDACDGDTDGDGVPPDVDNCPDAPNADQLDFDRDGQGDACDADPDGDGLDEATEAMRGTNPRAADSDGDGLADGADTCPTVADRLGLDKNADGTGDACDPDDDADGVPDWRDNCAQTANPDQADADADGTGDACAADLDGDGVADAADNCPAMPNPAQGAADCRGLFQRLTYGRDVRAVRGTATGAVAATAGGLGLVDDALVTVRSTADGLADNAQNGLATDALGNHWVVADGSVSVYKRNGTAVRIGPRDEGGGPQGRLRAVASDANGVVYVGGDAGLNIYANGAWTLLTAPQIPSADVRGLWLSPGGQVWAATAGGAVRLVNGAVDRTVTGLAGVGDVLNAVSGEADGSVWLLGENGAAHLPADGNVPLATYTGFSARALTVGPNGSRYLATADGLRRIDVDGRLFPAGAALLPSTDVRSVGAHEAGTPWVGTSEGLVRLDGYFASVTAGAGNFVSPCVNTTARIGSLLWIGTSDGLYVMNPDGTYRKLEGALPLPLVRVIRQVGQTVWVGTDGGIGLFGLDATPQGQLTAADGLPAAPISDVVEGVDGQVWIASAGNGIVRRNADQTFSPFTRESAGNNFLSNQVKALAHDGGTLWVGTDAGVSVWSEAAGAFQFPVTNQGGQLPDVRVQDLTVGGGLVYVATPQGVAVRRADNTWTTLRRATGGWPNSTGSDFAWSVAYDGEGLWVMLDDSQRQPTGVLLRRIGLDPLPENSEGGETVKVYTAANAGLVNAKGSSVRVEWSGQELFASWCGAVDDVGGFSVLDGRGAVVRDVSPGLGLPKGAGASALTVGPDGQPLYSAARSEATPFALGLTAPPDAASPPGQAPFELPPSVTGVLRKCAQAPGSGELWCALSGVGVGRRLDAQMWVVLDETRIRDLAGGDVRDIAVDGPQSIWIATGTGVIRLNQGNPRLYNTAGTAGGLPSDDVRAVALVSGGKLIAATSAGVGVFDPATMTWTAIPRAIGGLGNADVRAVAVAADGTAYFGTADGLFRQGLDGTFTDFHAARGLPSNDVRSVAVHTDGRVLVGTAAGLAIGTPAGADLTFTVAGFADGLPGRAVLDIVTAADGRIWVRSDDGVALLAN